MSKKIVFRRSRKLCFRRSRKLCLLNPPGKQRYHRDYYCTCVSKAKYYYHPLDLVYLSGLLSRDYVVYVLDAIAENLSPEETKLKIQKINPDYLLFLVSSPSYEEDTAFLSDLKTVLPQTQFIGTGDFYREFREISFELHSFLDAILTDYSTYDLLTYLDNKHRGKIIKNIIYKSNPNSDLVAVRSNASKHNQKIYIGPEIHDRGFFHLPVPRWDLFPLEKYSFPFSKSRKFARILTDFGCPYHCSFCPMSTLGYKLRDLETVIQEMKLVKKLGINELYIADQTFGVNKARTYELLRQMREENLNFSWTCFSRVDVVNEQLLLEMKKAGCHTIMFGIESANEAILKQYQKNTKISQIHEAIQLTKRCGLKVVGTFVIGLPNESRKSILKTIDFSTHVGLDFASFNMATPRFGTSLRKELLTQGVVDTKVLTMDSARTKPQWKKGKLKNEEIYALQRLAVKRFYLRPSYLLKRLLGIRTWYELINQIEEGWALITNR